MRRPSRSSSPFGGASPSDDDARAAAEFFALRPWLLEQPPSTAVPTLGSIEEVYATLPWLGEAPPKPTGPEPGSWEEVIALKPWLAWGEVEPSGSEPGSWEEVLVLKPWLGAQGELPGIDFDGIEGIDIDAGAPSEVTFGVRPIYRRRQPYALLGVNAPKVLLSDGIDAKPNKATYGSTDTILGDLESLGATFLRQPIRAEMVWPAGAEVPAVADGQAMYDAVFAGSTQELNLIDMFMRLTPRSDGNAEIAYPYHPMRVVLSLFSDGINSVNYVDSSGEYPDATGAGADATGVVGLVWPSDQHDAATVTEDWQGTVYNIAQYFSADHFDGATYTYAPRAGSDDYGWVYGTLDLRSPYKLKYIYYIGYALGRMLLVVNDAVVAAGHDPIWASILGVEVFNDSNKASPFMDYTNDSAGHDNLATASGAVAASARFWSLAVREMVRGIVEVFGDHAGPSLPLWLPSLAMYLDDGTVPATDVAPTFGDVLTFQQALCGYLVSDFATEADIDLTWFVNQDYHYYNYRSNQAPGLILRLVAEMAALKATFLPVRHGGQGIVTAAGHQVTISVCESGAPADLDNIDRSTFPYMGFAASADRFQAREVWRRLAAAATVSRYVCWHTHMSILTLPPDTTGFGYLGLRTDSGLPAHYEHGVYTVVSPNDVEQRLSWWAYHRFASLAFEHGDVRHIIARFVKPLPATAAYYQDSTISFSDIDYVGIVIEFTSGTRTSKVYNYLVMIDPVAPLYTSSFIRLSTSDGSTQTIEQWDTIPPEDTSTYTPVAAPTDGLSFPSSAPPAAWDSPTLTISSTSFPPPSDAPLVVTVDADPILIRCRQPLVVAWS